MFCAARQNPVVPLFIFIEEIVMEVSTTKKLICEDNDERKIGLCVCVYLVAHAQTYHTYNTHTLISVRVYVCARVRGCVCY